MEFRYLVIVFIQEKVLTKTLFLVNFGNVLIFDLCYFSPTLFAVFSLLVNVQPMVLVSVFFLFLTPVLVFVSPELNHIPYNRKAVECLILKRFFQQS